MPSNPNSNRFITFFTAIDSAYIRPIIVNYDSNIHENILNNVYAVNFVFANDNTDIIVNWNTYKNVSGSIGVAYSEVSNSIAIQNEVYQDSSNIGSTAYAALYTDSISLTNVTFNNVNGSTSDSSYYIHFHITDESDFVLTSISFKN